MKQIKWFKTTEECEVGKPSLSVKFREWVAFDKETKTPYWKGKTVIPTYKVEFLGFNDNILKTQYVKEGGDATPPTPPKVIGYDFDHWDGTYTSVTSDVAIKAEYTIKTFTVTFKDSDGTTLHTYESVEYGSSVEPPHIVHEGMIFKGWSSEDYLEVKADLEITALFEVQKFNVTFVDMNGNQIGEVQQINGGQRAVEPSDISNEALGIPEGYMFSAWTYDLSQPITEDLIISPIASPAILEVNFEQELID